MSFRLTIFTLWVNGFCACVLSTSPAIGAPQSSSVDEEASQSATPPVLKEEVTLTYPEEALAESLHGDVIVVVKIDTRGQVVEAQVESGLSVFHESALAAAQRLSFVPAQRDGHATPASTRIRFHFAPPINEDDGVFEVEVHADNPDLEDTKARTTLGAEELDRNSGQDLAETIAQVPGVQIAAGTSDAAKPIIRGQQERRLLVLYDSIRHESQKWGPDHGTEIDPFSAGSISVIRGAAGARFGPDAIGGVVLIKPPPLRVDPGVGGKAMMGFSTNGLRPYGALRLDAAPSALPGLAFRVEGNAAFGASRQAPDYVLGNTASTTWNIGTAAGYRWDNGQLRASWHHHSLRAGLFYGVQNSTPDEFELQLQSSRPATSDLWGVTHKIDRPYQDVSHDIAAVHGSFLGDWGTFEFNYAFQLNHRQEFEQVRDSITGPQYDFTLRTHSIDALYRHTPLSLAFGDLEGGAGLQGSFQENVYRGYSLLPNYRSFSGGVFAYERLSLPQVDLEFGARYDTLTRTAYMEEDDYKRHSGSFIEGACENNSDHYSCPAQYHTGSISFGALIHAVPQHLDLKIDLSSASRFPNVDELYLLGYAPSFPVYGIGTPNLGTETAWGGSLTAGLRFPWMESEISAYGSYVDDYIYFAPEIGEEGKPRLDVTIRGTWPRYTFTALQAAVYGVDASLSIAPKAPVGLEVRGAMVRAQELETGKHLIGTPPDDLHLALIGRPPSIGPLQNNRVSLTTDLIAKQSRTSPEEDFATAPDGYILIGVGVETTIETERVDLRVGLNVSNLLNTRYRSYTSLLRYYADQPGRDIQLRISATF